MARNEIIDKMRNFLINKDFSEECEVVYFLVELRKILDLKRVNKENITRFYADWIVHTSKDKIIESIEIISQKLFNWIKKLLEKVETIQLNLSSPINDFIYFKSLIISIESELLQEGINYQFTDEVERNFCLNLAKILSNQPLKEPIPEISKIIFTELNERACELRIFFTTPINGYNSYSIKNIY